MPRPTKQTPAAEALQWGDLVGQRTRIEVRMRDGVRLATDIYWPAGENLERLEPHPVLLERSPYGIRSMRSSDGVHADGTSVSPESGALFFVDRGYVVIRQDCRGRGGSEGSFAKYVNEADDGYDTHAWIGSQAFCDGRIATHGVSYSAHTQAAAASVGVPHLAAMIVDSGGFASAYESGGRLGGAFELKQVMWAYHRAITSPAAAQNPVLAAQLQDQNLEQWFAAMPWRQGFSPLAGVPEYERFLFEQWSHENFDDYWARPGLYARGYYPAFPDVAVLNISSWYDPYVRTAVENFEELGKQKHAPMFLLLGPWTHGARSLTHAGDVDFGPSAALDHNLASDYLALKADWLDAALSGQPASLSPVNYFLMGGGTGRRDQHARLQHGGTWRTCGQWPPAEASSHRLYLNPDQSLSWRPPATSGTIAYDFDPNHPVPSIGGAITSGEPLMRGGAYDQTPTASTFPAGHTLPLSARHDVVSFHTDPLEHDVLLVGAPELELDFSSSAPDTDITAKLIDVYPPNPDYPGGYAMNITDGLLRCRYRNSFHTPEPMTPGQPYKITLPLPDTANRFAPGHCIRLDISSSNFPRCDINPNTGQPVVNDRTSQVARNTLHIGSSHLRVTLLPA